MDGHFAETVRTVLTKFWPNIKLIWKYFEGYFVFGAISKVLWQLSYDFGLMFIVVYRHLMKK